MVFRNFRRPFPFLFFLDDFGMLRALLSGRKSYPWWASDAKAGLLVLLPCISWEPGMKAKVVFCLCYNGPRFDVARGMNFAA
jgi:hypothetical protein